MPVKRVGRRGRTDKREKGQARTREDRFQRGRRDVREGGRGGGRNKRREELACGSTTVLPVPRPTLALQSLTLTLLALIDDNRENPVKLLLGLTNEGG